MHYDISTKQMFFLSVGATKVQDDKTQWKLLAKNLKVSEKRLQDFLKALVADDHQKIVEILEEHKDPSYFGYEFRLLKETYTTTAQISIKDKSIVSVSVSTNTETDTEDSRYYHDPKTLCLHKDSTQEQIDYQSKLVLMNTVAQAVVYFADRYTKAELERLC